MSQGRGTSGNSNSRGRSNGDRGSKKGRGRGGRGRGRGRGRGGRGRGRGRFHNKDHRDGRNQENDSRQTTANTARSYTIRAAEPAKTMDAHENRASQSDVPIGAYQYCSREECEERQELKQVHELEATLETCSLPQAKRILDPCLAVSKFKRSAAGTSHTIKPAEVLKRTLLHLQAVCATRQATPKHPFVENLQSWAEFLVDRLRAIQSDATRLSSTNAGVSREWHIQLVRVLIWVRYWTYSLDDPSWLQRTINTMFGTAMESYWGQTLEGLSDADERQKHERMDDEMLCWSALLQASQQQEHQTINQTDNASCNSMLLDFVKLSTTRKISHHPMWCQVLTLLAHLIRHEYYAAWKKIDNITAGAASEPMSILFKCCIEPNLPLWRYRTIQQYNKSFAKEEHVTSVPRLLSIHPDEWNIDRAGDFELPVQPREDGEIALVFKKVPLEDDAPRSHKARSKMRDHRFAFGELYDVHETMCIASEHVDHALKYGFS